MFCSVKTLQKSTPSIDETVLIDRVSDEYRCNSKDRGKGAFVS